MTDTAIPLFCRRHGVLDITPFSDLESEQWWRLTLCRYMSALFHMSWSGGTIIFNTEEQHANPE